MKKIRNIKIKTHSSKNGKLIPMSFNKKFPMKVKRVFFIYEKKNMVRGNHAHKKCSQLFIPVLGEFALEIKTSNMKKKIMLKNLLKIVSSLILLPIMQKFPENKFHRHLLPIYLGRYSCEHLNDIFQSIFHIFTSYNMI